MLRLLEDPRSVLVAIVLALAALFVCWTVQDVIEAREKEERKETIDKAIDLAREGIRVWAPN